LAKSERFNRRRFLAWLAGIANTLIFFKARIAKAAPYYNLGAFWKPSPSPSVSEGPPGTVYSAYTWGIGTNYATGGPTTSTSRSSPVILGAASNWKKISAGSGNWGHAIDQDGKLWGWGLNNSGQLGNLSTTSVSSPVQIGSDTDWVDIDGGNLFAIGRKSTNEIYGWGLNLNGQCGIGSVSNASSPVKIGSDTDWSKISAGYQHALAIKSSGALYGWGLNISGEVGDASTTQRSLPVLVSSGTNWSAVSAGRSWSIGISTAGNLYTWGSGISGVQGNSTITPARSVPTQIGNNGEWRTVWGSVAAGTQTAAAIRSTGALYAWGDNGLGQVGDSSTTKKSSPVVVGSDTDWEFIAAWGTHTAGIRNGGALYTWGGGVAGQLGDMSVTSKSAPVAVVGPTNTGWVEVSLGVSYTMGYKT
jgi:alpha-tubulin suppressor-like RCC1 family protein